MLVHRSGALLGLSINLGALCHDGKTESRVHVHVSAIHAKLKDALNQAPKDHSDFQLYNYNVLWWSDTTCINKVVA